MANNDLNQIRIFVSVAQLQSFTKAAEVLKIEKSTVSTKVSQLEKNLNIRLLQRTTRKVSLTEAGEQYLSFCLAALEQLDKGAQFINELSDVPQGLLRVCIPNNMANVLLKKVIPKFLKQYPKVQLEIIQTSKSPDLLTDNFDLAIQFGGHELMDSSFIYRKIHYSDWIIVASKEYLAEQGEITNPEQLGELDNIACLHEGENIYQIYTPSITWKGKKIVFKPRFLINNMGNVIQALKQHIGFAVVPKNMVLPDIESGTVSQLFSEITLPSTAVYLVYPSRSGQPAKTKAFVEAMMEWSNL
ncbi:LysR family transcriptional regulator [Photobacterium sp. OFAV2-7]|uniref:LysR family transcriptional regulator n=1 Tax=Photobacterium sp. OFAV2-7 TaxID=2917748 RepID=UPI001EF6E29B|nr:LysR family transcriptional regulator [Photobacterium sp. OFAV2-7]MCG7584921.1 LysR family transcriptional regulator [Photobacterium sp. OFAV2-7]